MSLKKENIQLHDKQCNFYHLKDRYYEIVDELRETDALKIYLL